MKRYIKASYSPWESELENQLYQAWENYKDEPNLTGKDIADIVVEHLDWLIEIGRIDDAPDDWEAEARRYVENNIDSYYWKRLLVDDAPSDLEF